MILVGCCVVMVVTDGGCLVVVVEGKKKLRARGNLAGLIEKDPRLIENGLRVGCA